VNLDAYRLVERIVSGIYPDAADWARIVAAFRQYDARGGTLDDAFDLTAATRIRICRRELRTAAELLRAGRDMSTHGLAGDLADRLKRFESDKLPRYRRGGNVSMDAIELHLLEACQAGVRFPRSQRRLYDYLDSTFSG
jgi:hypothetical protein